MNRQIFSLPRIIVGLMVALTLVFGQDKNEPKVSQGEIDAAKKVQNAKDLPAKFKAAEEFMKKNSKSSLRPKVADYLANEIASINDPGQRLGHIESYSKIFNASEDQVLVLAAKVDALALTGKVEEAFKLAPTALEREPDNVILMTQLTLTGARAAQTGKPEFADKSRELGDKAIAMLEAGTKPAKMDQTYYDNFKSQWLPELYQSVGYIFYSAQQFEEARTRLEKGANLKPNNPMTFLMLAEIANAGYQKLAMDYNVASGAEKDKLLKQAEGQLDKVIEMYAHSIALMDGNAQQEAMKNQVMEQLTTYYKFRHNNSDNGLQDLIKKYKK